MIKSPLLETAIAAHGGLEQWNRLRTVKAAASIAGAIWQIKGRPDVLAEIEIEAALQTEKLEMRFPKSGKATCFEPGRISIAAEVDSEAKIFEEPIHFFLGHERETPWQDVHVAYFSGEALWTYLTAPFLYSYPGFEGEEIAPWREKGETWRRLKVIFPENIASHCREQISYFGPDGLLRRHDYTVDILGGATGANLAADYRTIDGIVVPTTRRVFAYEGDHVVVPEPLLVTIDLSEISFT